MPDKKWIFRLLDGTGFEGPNSGSGDHFKGTKLSSLVRELVQNSMDAHDKKTKPVKIVIFGLMRLFQFFGQLNNEKTESSKM